jgi:hypothetical protein
MLAFCSMLSPSELITGMKELVYNKLSALSVLLLVYELQWIHLPCPHLQYEIQQYPHNTLASSFAGCEELKTFSVQGVLIMEFVNFRKL